jgi:hypothetical protein
MNMRRPLGFFHFTGENAISVAKAIEESGKSGAGAKVMKEAKARQEQRIKDGWIINNKVNEKLLKEEQEVLQSMETLVDYTIIEGVVYQDETEFLQQENREIDEVLQSMGTFEEYEQED